MTLEQVFMSNGVNRVAIIRDILSGEHYAYSPANRAFTIALLKLLPQEELAQLLPDLIRLASWSHKYTFFAQQLILSLPRTWLVANLPQYVEKYLIEDNEEEWSAFLRLYSLLDDQMAQDLAQRAVKHPHSEVRAMGEEFLAQATQNLT